MTASYADRPARAFAGDDPSWARLQPRQYSTSTQPFWNMGSFSRSADVYDDVGDSDEDELFHRSFSAPPAGTSRGHSNSNSGRDFHPSQASFHGVPGLSPRVAELAAQARQVSLSDSQTSKQKLKQREEEGFYPVSYIRGEWLEQLMESGISKRRVRFLLSDETLCLGTSQAPITSEFSRPLVFVEAYLHSDSGPSDAKMYMSEYQVSWLVDEMYARSGEQGESSHLGSGKLKKQIPEFERIDVDRSKMVLRSQFKMMRKISFENSVGTFRTRCKLPVTNVTLEMAAKKQEERRLANASKAERQARGTLAEPKVMSEKASAPCHILNDNARASVIASVESHPSELRAASAPPSQGTSGSFHSVHRLDRQARQQAIREQYLAQHIAQQKANLPLARRLFKNIRTYGGAAIACDVESWTEDADVLLELGVSWVEWTGRSGKVEEKTGNHHWIIQETVQYKNEEIEATRWDYSLGKSETLPKRVVAERMQALISRLSASQPVILVFHDASAETRYFQKLGLDPTAYLTSIPAELLARNRAGIPRTLFGIGEDEDDEVEGHTTPPCILIQDTQDLYCGWSEPSVKQVNLGKACTALGIEATKLHNAGNDAAATLKVWEKLLTMPLSARQGQCAESSEIAAIEADSGRTPSIAEYDRSERDSVKAAAMLQPSGCAQTASDAEVDLITLW